MTKQLFSGMRGAYAVATELSKREYIVSPTSRSAKGADLLVTDAECRKTFSVQVKFDRRGKFWLIREVLVSPQHIYVFVTPNGETHDFYVVPSKDAERLHVIPERGLPSISQQAIEDYRGWWEAFS